MGPAPQHDPGLQPERTALAWNRTGLAVLVNALLILRSGLQHDSSSVVVLGFMLLFAAVVVTLFAVHRKRQLIGHAATYAPATSVIFTMALVAVFACSAALPVILLG